MALLKETAAASPRSRRLDRSSREEIVEAIIAEETEGAHRRVTPLTVDWSSVFPARVARILSALGGQNVVPPRELIDALLLAGHTVPANLTRSLEQRALNDLNRGTAAPSIIAADLSRLAEHDCIAPELAGVIVDRLAALGAGEEACGLGLALWRSMPEALSPIRTELASYLTVLWPLHIRLAGFSTTEVLAIDLRPAFGNVGRNAHVTQSGFGSALTTLLQPDANADIHVVLLDFDGMVARDWRVPLAMLHDRLIEQADNLSAALSTFAAHSSTPLLINSIPIPSMPTVGLLDSQHLSGLRHAVYLINQRLLAASKQNSNIIVVDADQALADIPSARHRDPKLWFYGRIAYSADASRAIASAFAQTWTLLSRGPAKVLALDLDNTLWGGTYGEDGVERLACGEDYPGNAFQAFQQECLRLKRQGLLLVALSKNDPEAITVFERHTGMILKEADFAATAINWQPKSQNIRRIANELNLGLDSVIFIDDSPHEREAMRRLVPEIIIPELPSDPARRPFWLRRLVATWPVRLTDEDERRTEMYAAERQSRDLKSSATSVEDYLSGLQQCLVVSLVSPDTVARIAQMHQRTNQFNLTTRRLSEAEVAAYVGCPNSGLALLGRVTDKFGDQGIVITATVSIRGSDAEIETFLMSCRVIGREIEKAFLVNLLLTLAKRGIERVTARFLSTQKNGLVCGFYQENGFSFIGGDDSASSWAFDLNTQLPPETQFVATVSEI
jgi:FkbH-like protein